MPEFFLELFSEEIPARMQADAAFELGQLCSAVFTELNMTKGKFYYGPRRLAVSATINESKAGGLAETRGPRASASEAALLGFLTKWNAAREEILVEEGYYFLRRNLPSESAQSLIKKMLPSQIEKLRWPKSMRWVQAEEFVWVRPLRRVTCLLDGIVIPIEVGSLKADRLTEGHRVLSNKVLPISSSKYWEDELSKNFVIADQNVRRVRVVDGLQDQASLLSLTVVKDADLIEEVIGLVEWPLPLIGKIDHEFMSLPTEVRELSMKVNQKYFALRNLDGEPAPYFAFVANLEAPDGGASIIAGNERVLRARLSDAHYFWSVDIKTPLSELLPKLDQITFHAKVGNQRQRAERISKLARLITDALDGDGQQARQAEWAGLLCKTDLVTGMVREFPELQGVMGGYYAERSMRGWDGGVVGPAIRTHYQPKGPADAVPTGVVAVSVALADKIDTLREFFRIGEAPTGSGDPYALRRAALGVIRIILENELRLPLRPLLGGDEKLFAFIIERLRVKLRGEGRRFDVLDAVLGAGTDDDLTRVMQRVDAVSAFLAGPDGANLIVAYRRAANILRIEDAKDGPHRGADFGHLSDSAEERDFAAALAEVENQTIQDFLIGRYDEAMTALARLRAPVDGFFDKVTVNAAEPELRLNRLRLLALLRDTMNRIADFSRVEN